MNSTELMFRMNYRATSLKPEVRNNLSYGPNPNHQF